MNYFDEFQLDLFHTLKASNAPLVLYDRIIVLIKYHGITIRTHGTNSLTKHKIIINDLNHRLYGTRGIMKPSVHNLTLSSDCTSNIVTFSLKDMILRMLTNKSLFHPDNLLFDPNNPCALPNDTLFYGDVNSGSCNQKAIENKYTDSKHILMSFFHFID